MQALAGDHRISLVSTKKTKVALSVSENNQTLFISGPMTSELEVSKAKGAEATDIQRYLLITDAHS